MRQNAYGPEDRQGFADHVRKMTKHLAPHIREAGETYADYIERGFPYVDTGQNALVIGDSSWIFDGGHESQLADKADLDSAHGAIRKLRRQIDEMTERHNRENAAHARKVQQLQEIIDRQSQK